MRKYAGYSIKMRENDKILVQNIAVFIHINIVFFYLCILNNIVYSS